MGEEVWSESRLRICMGAGARADPAALVESGSYLEREVVAKEQGVALIRVNTVLCVVWFSGLGWFVLCGDKVELLSCFSLGTDGGGKGVEMTLLS